MQGAPPDRRRREERGRARLNGVVGRKAGTYLDYAYSDANKNSGITWDEATLKEYLKNPRARFPAPR